MLELVDMVLSLESLLRFPAAVSLIFILFTYSVSPELWLAVRFMAAALGSTTSLATCFELLPSSGLIMSMNFLGMELELLLVAFLPAIAYYDVILEQVPITLGLGCNLGRNGMHSGAPLHVSPQTACVQQVSRHRRGAHTAAMGANAPASA